MSIQLKVDQNSRSKTALPAISPGYGRAAYCIQASGTAMIVGFSGSEVNGVCYARPTVWELVNGVWTRRDLGSFEANNPIREGYAYAVNGGVVAGKSRNSSGYWQAFRNASSASTLSALPFPPADAEAGLTPHASTANGINIATAAVGASDTVVTRGSDWNGRALETRATLWWGDTAEALSLWTVFPIAPDAFAADPGYSEAMAVNWPSDCPSVKVAPRDDNERYGVTVVGMSWKSPSGYPTAFVMDIPRLARNEDTQRFALRMLNLNDPHLTHFPSGLSRAEWDLKLAKSINNRGYIVGTALQQSSTSYGYRGFVLIPQTEVVE